MNFLAGAVDYAGCYIQTFRCGKCTLVNIGCCSTRGRVLYRFDNGRVINPVIWLSALLGHQIPHFLPYEIERAKEMVADMRWLKANSEENAPKGFPFVRDITNDLRELEWD